MMKQIGQTENRTSDMRKSDSVSSVVSVLLDFDFKSSAKSSMNHGRGGCLVCHSSSARTRRWVNYNLQGGELEIEYPFVGEIVASGGCQRK
ncbi:unnamed protein product [Amoebophrya sp. A25]|nr:unnamed protein product [Amoebophrya sp. A25]|eukprot:GSA25T00011943001.1